MKWSSVRAGQERHATFSVIGKAMPTLHKEIAPLYSNYDHNVHETLATLGMPVVHADVSQPVAFAEAFASGQTVLDFDSRSQAAREIEAFVTELLRDYEQKDSHNSTAAGRVARGR